MPLLLLTAWWMASGCAPRQRHASAKLEHPSASNRVERGTANFFDDYIWIAELTNERICVEFEGSRDFGEETERESEKLRQTVAVVSTPGKASLSVPVTQSTGGTGKIRSQYCADNTIIGPETESLGVVLAVGNQVYHADFTLEGGQPSTGSWGARGRTVFPSEAEMSAQRERTASARATAIAHVTAIVAELEKAGSKCSPVPQTGMTKVECQVQNWHYEIWDAYGDGRQIQLISFWKLKQPLRCDSYVDRNVRNAKRRTGVSGELNCHLEQVKLTQTSAYREGISWADVLQKHLDDGAAVSSKLVRYGLVP
jgi:hypothetical protein